MAAPAALSVYVPETDEEAKAILEADLESIRAMRSPETRIEDAATLEDMIGEATELRRRGKVFYMVPPVIADLSQIIKLMNKSVAELGAGNQESSLAYQIEIARRMLWLKEGDALRTAREEEITASFGLAQLTQEILKMLVANGLDVTPGKA